MFDLVYIKVENNPSTRYYEKKQREVVIKASERYQSPSEEDEEKKPQYGHKRYKNLPEHEKQKLVVHEKLL